MELSKQERHEIYKMARQFFIEEMHKKVRLKNWYSMCFHIHCAFVKITDKEFNCLYGNYQQMCLILTEFDSLRPDNCFYGEHWWDEDNYVVRIKKFDELIEMTKP